MGLLDKRVLRAALFYRISVSDKYYDGDEVYSGDIGTIKKAVSNYLGLLVGYGISEKLTIEMETVYVINKTHLYEINDEKLSGFGLSDAVISLRPRIFSSQDSQFEISCAIGSNIPFSRDLQRVNGVTLPVDLQPSTGSYGLVAQSNIIKEFPFSSINFLLINRFEKYFENKQKYNYGNSYSTSFFFSKHFSVENSRLQGWTAIMQLKNQIRSKHLKDGQLIEGSGNCSFFLIPQLNVSLAGSWNISMLIDIPVYQHFNEIQLGNKLSSSIILIKDFTL
ncbi:MAG TPA: hypothetical protein DDW27_05485 [Bacteroidales bacterium]|nr:hypothetical protein [Bacteroidales bacterium]